MNDMKIFKVEASKETAFEGTSLLLEGYWQTKEDASIAFKNAIDWIIKEEELDVDKMKKVHVNDGCWWYKDAACDDEDFPDEYIVTVSAIEVLTNKK